MDPTCFGSGGRSRTLIAVSMLVIGLLSACGRDKGDSGHKEVQASAGGEISVSTGSGDLTLVIPAGALSEDTTIGVSLVQPDDLPESIGSATDGNPAWRLEPSGLALTEPATVTLVLDQEQLARTDSDGGISAFFLDVVGDDGVQSALENVSTVHRSDGSTEVSGQLDHFSWLWKTDASLRGRLEQIEPRQRPVNNIFEAERRDFTADYSVAFELPGDEDPGFHVVLRAARIGVTGPVSLESAEGLIGGDAGWNGDLLEAYVDGFDTSLGDVQIHGYSGGELRAYDNAVGGRFGNGYYNYRWVSTDDKRNQYVPLPPPLSREGEYEGAWGPSADQVRTSPVRQAHFECVEEGNGTYFLQLTGHEWGKKWPRAGRIIEITIEAEVECVSSSDGGAGGGATTGADGSSSSGASSSSSGSSGSSSGPSAPTSSSDEIAVVIQPCLVIDQARAASFLGTAVGPLNLRDEEREGNCSWVQTEGATAPEAIGLTMSVSRNSAAAAGMIEAWRTRTEDASEVRDVPWSELGELRIEQHTVGDPYSSVALFALAFNSDGPGGDIYLMLWANGPPGTAASSATMLETIAEELRDAVLAAQP